eukprot:15457938-Alexandrium_andersonii.AAC.1
MPLGHRPGADAYAVPVGTRVVVVVVVGVVVNSYGAKRATTTVHNTLRQGESCRAPRNAGYRCRGHFQCEFCACWRFGALPACGCKP